ncbi:MAG: fibrobacter succinogenes major paralogous domain-containing protein [Bacteroidales bacterium]|nr:fibrobacter succinogenes major paralogous domain-containing protein [Bacteroidales bacterium]
MKAKNRIWVYPSRTIGIFIMFLSISFKSIAQESNKSVKDIDGNVYRTVRIGTQIWMRDNLKTTKYNDGTEIPNVRVDSMWSSLISGAYCNYNNTEDNARIYGRLYNWYVGAFTNPKNVCPEGWHVPTHEEWITLTFYLGDGHRAGGKMKEKGTIHWNRPNTGATDKSGFSALPSGCRYYYGTFEELGEQGLWWSSSEFNLKLALFEGLSAADSSITDNSGFKSNGFSIRCIKSQNQ